VAEESAKAERFVTEKVKASAESRRRRNVYVNTDLPQYELDKQGLPVARYARNKGNIAGRPTARILTMRSADK
jgi:hypothetical protein